MPTRPRCCACRTSSARRAPLHDPDLRGVFAGMHLGHTRADLYRSVLEAIAFGFRHHVDVFTDIGIPPTRVMITNGGPSPSLWKQIHADVLGMEMRPVRGIPVHRSVPRSSQRSGSALSTIGPTPPGSSHSTRRSCRIPLAGAPTTTHTGPGATSATP